MPNARRLLVVDDDQDLRDTLTEQLALYDEFEILSADTAASAINQAKADCIDLAIVDVALPDMDGREAVKIMRRNGFRSPIIMLTGQASEADTVLGLEAGANDYVVKPFKFSVLLARIRAQLRQYEASEDAVFQIASYTFRAGAKLLVSEKGSKLKLTEKETAILRLRCWKSGLGCTLPERSGIGLPVWRRGPAGSIPMKRVAAPERTRERLRALMDGRLGTAPDRSNLVLLAAQLIVEEALEAEVRDEVGRERYERAEGEASGYRNGYRTGRMKTAEGVVEFAAPQVRDTAEPFVSGIRQNLGVGPARSRTWRSSSTMRTVDARHRRRVHGRSRTSAAEPGGRERDHRAAVGRVRGVHDA